MRPFLFCWVLGLLSFVIPPPLSAQTSYTWTGKSGSAWGNPENWSPIGVPKEGDSAILDLQKGNINVHVGENDFVSLNELTVNSPAILLTTTSSVQVQKLRFQNGTIQGGFYSVGDGFIWNGGKLDNANVSVFGASEMSGEELTLVKSYLFYQGDLAVTAPVNRPMTVWTEGGSITTYFGDRSIYFSGDQSIRFQANPSVEPITTINISGRLTKTGSASVDLTGVLTFGDILVEAGLLTLQMSENPGNPFFWFSNTGVHVEEGGTLLLVAAHEKHSITSYASFSGKGNYEFVNGNWDFTVFEPGGTHNKTQAKQNTSIAIGGTMRFSGASASVEATANINIGNLIIGENANVRLKTATFTNETAVNEASLLIDKSLLTQNLHLRSGRLLGGGVEVQILTNFLSGETDTPTNMLGNGVQLQTMGESYVNAILRIENKSKWTNSGTAYFNTGTQVILSDGEIQNTSSVSQERTIIEGENGKAHRIGNNGDWFIIENTTASPINQALSKRASVAASNLIGTNFDNLGRLVMATGSLEISGNLSNTIDGAIAGSQELILSGTHSNLGQISPGNDGGYNKFGTLTITPQNATGTIKNTNLWIDLANNQQDLLKVSGTFDLSGTVEVIDVDGSVANEPVGRVFTIIEATNLINNKPTYTLPTLGEGKTWSVNQNAGTVFLRIDSSAPANAPPVANNDQMVINEDTSFPLLQLLTNDTDPDQDTFSLNERTNPQNGTFVVNQQQQLVYVPNANFFGSDSFTYNIKDARGAISAFATVAITINPINDAPVAKDDGVSTNEDTPITLDLLKNDSDLDNDPLTVQVVTQPQSGTLSFSQQTQQYSYTPNLNFFGQDQFTYQAKDPAGALSNLATVFIKINAVNDAPVAKSDRYQTEFNKQLIVEAPGVLKNDSDPDGETLVAIRETNPASGVLTLLEDGSFTFDPAKDFTGDVVFGYFARDPSGVGSNVVEVVVSVGQNPNQPPVAFPDQVVADEDTPTILSLTANDTDPNQDPITIASFTQSKNGTLSFNQQQQLVYTPKKDFNGTDSFTYIAKDPSGANSNEAAVSITVRPINDAPTATADQYVTNEDTQVLLNLLENDLDVDGDVLTVELVDQPSNGRVFLDQEGQRFYLPNTNFHGVDQFTYRAKDPSGAVSATVTVTITVSPVNDPPVANNDTYQTDEDVAVSLALTSNDEDPDKNYTFSDALVKIETSPTKGSVAPNQEGIWVYTPNKDLNGNDSFTYSITDPQGAKSNTATVTLSIRPVNDAPVAENDQVTTPEDTPVALDLTGNDKDIDDDLLTAQPITNPKNGTLTVVNGVLTYAPNKNFNGSDSFTYQAKDPSQAGSNTATVSLTVTPVNDPPIALADQYTTDEDISILLNLLENDSDIEGGALTVVITSEPQNGTFNFDQQGQRIYKPNPNYHGTDEFMYLVQDTEGARSVAVKVSITIRPVNDPPIANANAYQTNFNTTLNVAVPGVLGNDNDVDGDALEAVLITTVTSGTLALQANGGFTYTPATGFSGDVSFTYQAKDPSNARSATTQVLVSVGSNPNRPPIATNDELSTDEDVAITLNVLANDSDPNQDPLTVELVSPPTKGTLSTNQQGQWVYTPNKDFNGLDTFTYRAKDPLGALSNVATVSITIRPVNDPPVAVADLYTTNEDTQVLLNLLQNDSDVDGDLLTVEVMSPPGNGTLSVDPQNNRVYIPNLNFFGTDRFTYRAIDPSGATSAIVLVTITVNPVNDPPVATNDAYQATAGTTLEVAAAGVLDNDSDVEQESLTAILVSNTTTGSAVLRTDGGFSYSAPVGFFGTVTFTYQAQDASGARSNTATVNIQVQAAQNRAPIAVNDEVVVNEDTFVTLNLLANDTDPENDLLTVIVLTQPQNGLLLDQQGALRYIGNTDFNGTDQFTYQARDVAGNLSNVGIVRITVRAVNDPPNAVNDEVTTDEDVAINIAVLSNDVDTDQNDALIVANFTNPGNGTVSLLPNGILRYQPNLNFNGQDFFTYMVQDAAGARSGIARVTILVRPVNDPPKGMDDTYNTAFNKALTVTAPGVLENDSDPDVGDKLVAIVENKPVTGDLVLQENGGFTYTPAKDFSGEVTFTYRARDAAGATSTPVTVTIDIGQNPNRPPIAFDDQLGTSEDQAVDINVLTNDRDPNGDVLQIDSFTQPINGSVSRLQNGLLRYTPKPDFNGLDSFGYVAVDPAGLKSNHASIQVTVTPVNDPPIAVDDVATTSKNASVVLNLLSNDRDADGDPLSVGVMLQPSKGILSTNGQGQLVYTPNRNIIGEEVFTYAALDPFGGKSNTAKVTINIENANAAPIASADQVQTLEDEAVLIPVLRNDTDPDDDPLTILLDTLPNHGGAEVVNNEIRYMPSKDFNGFDQFRYRVRDTGHLVSLPVTVSVEVKPVNDPPVAFSDAFEAGFATFINIPAPGVLGNDVDTDGDALAARLVNTTSSGTLSLSANGALQFVPAPGFFGEASFTYRAQDAVGAFSDLVTVTLTIRRNPNRVPLAINDAAATNMNLPVTIMVLQNDQDLDGDQLSVSLSGLLPLNGVATVNSNETITYVPNRGFMGTDEFEYTISDGKGGTASARVQVQVQAITYRLTEVQSLGNAARAWGINDAGEIIGVTKNAIGQDRAFFWNSKGMTLLGNSVGQALGLSETGIVTGFMRAPGGTDEAFLWRASDPLAPIQFLGHLGGGFSIGNAVSNDGKVVGASFDNNNHMQAFTFAGKMENIHNFGEKPQSEAFDINLAGVVAGLVYDGAGAAQAFRNTTVFAGDSRAYRINNLNVMVGSSQAGDNVRAIRWDDNAVVPLPSLSGNFSEAYGINDMGWIVGAGTLSGSLLDKTHADRLLPDIHPHQVAFSGRMEKFYTTAALSTRAVLWLDDQTFDLNSLIPANSGWVLKEARDVNRNGAIVGYGLLNGQTRAFVLNPVTNSAPIAKEDVLVLQKDHSYTINVLDNDRDPDADRLRVLGVFGAQKGKLIWQPDGRLQYIFNQGLSGNDQFFYVVGDGVGGTHYARVTVSGSSVGIEEDQVPMETGLLSVYPNPVQAQATISFKLAQSEQIRVALYDVLGRKVKTITNDTLFDSGEHRLSLNTEKLPNGLYFVRMETASAAKSLRMVVRR
ncbi:MAG: tandem-95 repeat protein [Bacteroidetes Order II. Incertae sedis bacterium]|nr:tandem-95 repeat protein [Bacteroidetes Order II. bacterium]